MNDRHANHWLLYPPLDGPPSILAIRLMAGAVFFWEGLLKFVYENQGLGRFTKLGWPFPQATASFVGGLEIGGGLLLMLGLGTRLVSSVFVVEMLVAMLTTKPRLFLGTSPLPPPPVPPQAGLWAVLHEIRSEYAQLMSSLFLLAAGPGPLSLDARWAAVPDAAHPRPAERVVPTKRASSMLAIAALLLATRAVAGGSPAHPITRRAPDAVVAGATCIDRCEASVWRVPNPTTTDRPLVGRIEQGAAPAASLGMLNRRRSIYSVR